MSGYNTARGNHSCNNGKYVDNENFGNVTIPHAAITVVIAKTVVTKPAAKVTIPHAAITVVIVKYI